MKYLILALTLTSFSLQVNSQDTSFMKSLMLMGSVFEIEVVTEPGREDWASEQIEHAIQEIKRIEGVISSWDPDSETSRINKLAGIEPVKVDRELFELITRSLYLSELSQGAFDITYASMDRVWKFDGSMDREPSDEEIEGSVSLVGFQDVVIDEGKETVFLQRPGMRIGFGAIGKGYAADKAAGLLMSTGVRSGVINASGDMFVWGSHPGGGPWKIGIADPDSRNNIVAWLEITDVAIVTSGNYEKFVEIEGQKYSHIIDPRSGWPVTGLKSVTVIAPSAEFADALATALFVMGPEAGIYLVDQLDGVECLFIDENDKIWQSANMQLKSPGNEDVDFKSGGL
jgi:thiamine biosynthesis lipoprotein